MIETIQWAKKIEEQQAIPESISKSLEPLLEPLEIAADDLRPVADVLLQYTTALGRKPLLDESHAINDFKDILKENASGFQLEDFENAKKAIPEAIEVLKILHDDDKKDIEQNLPPTDKGEERTVEDVIENLQNLGELMGGIRLIQPVQQSR